jgi:hypothetical protein
MIAPSSVQFPRPVLRDPADHATLVESIKSGKIKAQVEGTDEG